MLADNDIIFSYAGFLPTLAAAGYLEPLDNLNTWDAYANNEKEAMLIDGHYYGIPMERTVIGMYCNLDVLTEYGLDLPDTYEDFLNACKILHDAGMTPIASSQLLPFSGYAYADGLASIYSSENASEKLNALASGTEEYGDSFINGFTSLQELLEDEYIDRSKALANDTTAQAEQDFAGGKAAFLLGASDLGASILAANPDVHYVVYPIPIESGEGVILTAPDHLLCVNANSPNKEIALDFIAFCTKPENIEKYVSAQGSLSPLAGATTQSEQLEPVIQLIQDGKALPSVNYSINPRLQNWIQKAGIEMLGGATADDTVYVLNELIRQSEVK